MKRLIAITMLSVTFLTGFASCTKNNRSNTEAINNNNTENNNPVMSSKIKITIGSRVFTATLLNNATATAFAKMLPLNMNMTELNGNEKYFDLPANLPANANNPGDIHSGDLMLYGSRTVVVFYNDFSTSYSYTRLGKVDDAAGFTAALGSGNVTVSISLER
jgi:hypothetical protein